MAAVLKRLLPEFLKQVDRKSKFFPNLGPEKSLNSEKFN